LNKERIALVNALDFEWALKESFEQRLEDLKAYKLKHGHLNLKRSDDPSLYNFCCNIKTARNNPSGKGMKVTEERIASLDTIGFDWGNKKKSSGQKELKKREGVENRNIHHDSLSDGEEDVKSTREPAKKRKRVLYASGDKKKRTRVSFQQRIDELKAYKDEHGHMNVKRSENKSLYDFCNNIKHAHKHPDATKKRLTEDRIASLNAVGFDWTVKEKVATISFEQRLEDLKTYKLKHGHLNVRKEEDPSLYNFCNSMKTARNNPSGTRANVSEERIASLDAIGFEWAVKENKRTSFQQRLDELKAYKMEHGHLRVRKEDDPSLYNFCINIRNSRNKSDRMKVTEERIASLDAIGFEWVAKETKKVSFHQRLDDLKAYKLKHGHLNVKKEEDKSLYDFCHNIRYARIHPEKSVSVVNEERKASLDGIGFNWGKKKSSGQEELVKDLMAIP